MVALSRENPRRTIVSALARAGWHVVLATTSTQAIDVARRDLPDLVVVGSDLEPIADGVNAAQAIADLELGPRRPRLVLVSAHNDEQTAALARAARVDRVVIVPEPVSGPGLALPSHGLTPPGSTSVPAGGAPEGRHETAPGSRQLWVVDDNQAVRLLVRHAFARERWSVREFEDLASAQRAAVEVKAGSIGQPHAIVLDIHLPDGNGLDNVRRFAATGAAIVVVSNLAGPEHVERAFAAGAADLVSKPFDPRNLVARVARAVMATPPGIVSHDVIPTVATPASANAPSVVMTHWG